MQATAPRLFRTAKSSANSVRRSGLLSILVMAFALLPGCGDKPPQLPTLAPDDLILAFGDSLTRGTGAGDDESYPAILERLARRRVVNAGVPGETSAGGLARLAQALDEFDPSLLILCHGGNDMLRKISTPQTEANLRAMIQLAQDRGIGVVLIGVPKPGLLLGTADFYDAIATSMQLPFESEILTDILGDAALKSDPVHPNGAGYGIFAAAIHGLLQESGAL